MVSGNVMGIFFFGCHKDWVGYLVGEAPEMLNVLQSVGLSVPKYHTEKH